MNKFIRIILIIIITVQTGCSDYLDVVPEGTASIENVYTSRETVLKFLYSCYWYMASERVDPMDGMEVCGVGELWTYSEPQWRTANTEGVKIAEGQQSPFVNLYNRWHHLFAGINNCNTLISGLPAHRVPDLQTWERDQIIAEAKVLKAWYHFYLLRMYGPIPVIRENLPVSTSVEGVQVPREPVDVAFDYMAQLLDEAAPYLPTVISNPQDYGRINKGIALSVKAQILVTAASPLFNCNAEMAPLKNNDGTQLFPQGDEPQRIEKWKLAAQACDSALNFCVNTAGMKLYEYPGHPTYNLTPVITRQLTLRQAFCERWSSEVIWAYTGAWVHDLQFRTAMSIGQYSWSANYNLFGAPLSMVEQFYSSNGVPIREDKYWDYNSRFDLRTATAAENLYLRERETNVRMNFDREPRFYAWLAFDRGVFYGWGREDDSNPGLLLYYTHRRNGSAYSVNESAHSPTGYTPKKYIHWKSQGVADEQMAVEDYIWPLMRLPDLMLLYAEAVNEAEDSPAARDRAIAQLDIIRERAGLYDVKYAWDNFTENARYNTQDGLRDIIRQERTIELMFEGKRYYDLRRWKTAPEVLNAPVQGWAPRLDPELYYRPTTIHEQTFGLKDYFSPIPDTEIQRNRNLKQNLGW